MNLDIQSTGFPITDALSGHTQRRLQFALTRHTNRIAHVAVRLGDDNGPRGGIDKFCRIQVQLVDARTAVIEDTGADMYAVIDRAADRVGRVVVKHLERSRVGGRDPRPHGTIAAFDELEAEPHAVHSERPSA